MRAQVIGFVVAVVSGWLLVEPCRDLRAIWRRHRLARGRAPSAVSAPRAPGRERDRKPLAHSSPLRALWQPHRWLAARRRRREKPTMSTEWRTKSLR